MTESIGRTTSCKGGGAQGTESLQAGASGRRLSRPPNLGPRIPTPPPKQNSGSMSSSYGLVCRSSTAREQQGVISAISAGSCSVGERRGTCGGCGTPAAGATKRAAAGTVTACRAATPQGAAPTTRRATRPHDAAGADAGAVRHNTDGGGRAWGKGAVGSPLLSRRSVLAAARPGAPASPVPTNPPLKHVKPGGGLPP
eukprot:gene35794-51884_t